MYNSLKISSLETRLERNSNLLNYLSSQYLRKFRIILPSLENEHWRNYRQTNNIKAASKFRKGVKIAQKKSGLDPPLN